MSHLLDAIYPPRGTRGEFLKVVAPSPKKVNFDFSTLLKGGGGGTVGQF